MNIKFNIDPVAKGRPRVTKTGHTFTPKGTRTFTDRIRALAADLEPLSGALQAEIIYVFKRPLRLGSRQPVRLPRPCRPDLDNLDKALLDALNGLAYEDDQQVCKLTSSKVYAAPGEDPCIEVEITPLIAEDCRALTRGGKWGDRSTKVEALLAGLERGESVSMACIGAGISERTFYYWQSESEELKEAFEMARAKGEIYFVDQLQACGKERSDWRAFAWLLERRFPERWGAKRELTLMTPKQDGLAEVMAMIEQTNHLLDPEAQNEGSQIER